jgi:hypothetical protein
MQDNSPVDRGKSLVDGYANAPLAELVEAGPISRPQATTRTAGEWTVFVIACPKRPGEGVPGLTDCDRDCLACLAQAQRPMPAWTVREELEKVHSRIYGLITVKRSLAKLHRKLKLVSVSWGPSPTSSGRGRRSLADMGQQRHDAGAGRRRSCRSAVAIFPGKDLAG